MLLSLNRIQTATSKLPSNANKLNNLPSFHNRKVVNARRFVSVRDPSHKNLTFLLVEKQTEEKSKVTPHIVDLDAKSIEIKPCTALVVDNALQFANLKESASFYVTRKAANQKSLLEEYLVDKEHKFAKKSASVEMEEEATALYAVDKARIAVGSKGSVWKASFENGATISNVRNFQNSIGRKAVDAFAHEGNVLVAIDDIVYPKYGITFNLAKGMEFMQTCDLPASTYEQYHHAALTDNVLVMTTSGVGRLGSYQRLIGMRVDGFQLQEQFVATEMFDPFKHNFPHIKNLVGKSATSFGTVATISNGAVAVAATDRGLIIVNVESSKGENVKCHQVDLKGSCLYVQSLVPGKVLALVQKDSGDSELVVVKYEDQYFSKVIAHIPVKGTPSALY